MSETNQLATETVLEEAKRLFASKEFTSQTPQSQYASFVQTAADAADGSPSDKSRLNTFQVIMKGFLGSSSWHITGSQYTLANVTSVLGPQVTDSIDDIIASTYQPANTMRLYIAATGLSNVD